ncbi:MAG: signal peptidase I [Thermoplasmata archaeon]
MNRSERLPQPRALVRPLLLFAAAFAVTQGYLYESPHLPLRADLAVGLLVPAALFGLFLLWTRWDGEPLSSYGFALPKPWLPALGLAGFLVVIQTAVLLEPGFGFGFARQAHLSPIGFGYALALAPLSALGQEAVFRGYIFGRLLSPRRFASALGISSTTFALTLTNFPILHSLGTVELGTYLLTNTAIALTLGLVLAFYYYKSSRNLLGPFVLRTGGLLVASLTPVVSLSPGWVFVFLIALFADAVLLLVILATLREPKLVARRYLGEPFGPRRDRFLGKLRRRHQIREAVVVGVVALLVVVGVIGGVPYALGTDHPFLAIETGSMVPTLHRGTLVVIQHVPASEITVGTIVAYTTTCLPSPVVHRVVAIASGPNGPVFTTKGDANPSADTCPVPYSSVLGRVAAIVPWAGFFILSPALTAGTLVVAALLGTLFWPSGSGRFPHRRPSG